MTAVLLLSAGYSSTRAWLLLTGSQFLYLQSEVVGRKCRGHSYFHSPLSVWIGLGWVHPVQYEVWAKDRVPVEGGPLVQTRGSAFVQKLPPMGAIM